MENREFIIKKFKEVKALGFVISKRKNSTGIGKTFEDYAGIKENNLDEPDLVGYEIKSHRELSNSYVTLFTKAPTFPKRANNYLNKTYGIPYEDPLKKHLKKLHTSIYANHHNSFANKLSFRLINDRAQETIKIGVYDIETRHLMDDTVGYNYNILKKVIKKKLHNLFYVSAETKFENGRESFYFNKADIYSEPSFEKFLNLIDEGLIMYDIRIGSNPNGTSHDHGSGFRMLQPNIKLLYKRHEIVE